MISSINNDILFASKKIFSLRKNNNKNKQPIINMDMVHQAMEDYFVANAKSVIKKTQTEQADGTIVEKTEIIKQPENTEQQKVIGLENQLLNNAKKITQKIQTEQDDGTIIEKIEIIESSENTDKSNVIDVEFEEIK